MSITRIQAQAELDFRAQPKATRVRTDECPATSPAFGAGTAQLEAIVAKGRKAPAKATAAKPAKVAKAPKAKPAPKNPEANAAFQAALANGEGLKAAHRAFRTVMQGLSAKAAA